MGKQAPGIFSPIANCLFSGKKDNGRMAVSRQQIVFALVYNTV